MAGSGTAFPFANFRCSRKENQRQPEFKKYASVEHFFNEKRLDLLDYMSPTCDFHNRVVPDSRGRRIFPLPPGEPPEPQTIEEVKKSLRERGGGSRESEAQRYLGRYQLLAMLDRPRTTEEQQLEYENSMPKMVALAWRYGLLGGQPQDQDSMMDQAEAETPATQYGEEEGTAEEADETKEGTSGDADEVMEWDVTSEDLDPVVYRTR